MCSKTTPARVAHVPARQLREIRRQVTFKTYLDRTYKKVWEDGSLGPDFGLRTHVPVSIYLRSKGADHIYAGNSFVIDGTLHHLDEEECFSASLIKVAAMFAAYKLRQEAEALRADVNSGAATATLANFFNKLAQRVHPATAVPIILSAANIRKQPSLRDILQITSFASPVTFTNDFRSHLRKMIIPSDDCDAGECIWRLSYPYINVKLMEDGFFDRTSMKGIWLAGDYIEDFCFNRAKKQNYVRINTVNDCDQVTHFCGSAQNTTSIQMARLFLKILLEELVDQQSSQEMKAILHEAEHGSPPGTPPPAWASAPDVSFLDVVPGRASGSVPKKFTIEGVKIGQAAIKRDPQRGNIEVRSEGLHIKWKNVTEGEPHFDADLKKKFDDLNLTGEAAVCWQNLSNVLPDTDGIIEIINDSIDDFVNQAPVAP